MTLHDDIPGDPGDDITEDDERYYVELDMNDDQTIIYDSKVETAWIQSDVTVEMERMA